MQVQTTAVHGNSLHAPPSTKVVGVAAMAKWESLAFKYFDIREFLDFEMKSEREGGI